MYFHTAGRAGGGRPEDLPPGTLWIWRPGDPQIYGHERRGFLHSWIHCDGDAVAGRFGRCGARLPGPVPMAGFGGFLRFLDGLHAEASETDPDPVIAGNLFENWLRDLSRRSAGSASGVPERLRKVREWVENHYSGPVTLAQLAKMACWSPAHFSERFRAAYGTSPMDYVIQVRLRHAEYLLGDINLTVEEVARRVGYEDGFHFSKLFKRHRGRSPGRARGSLRKR